MPAIYISVDVDHQVATVFATQRNAQDWFDVAIVANANVQNGVLIEMSTSGPMAKLVAQKIGGHLVGEGEHQRHVVAGEDGGGKYKKVYQSYGGALEAAREIVKPELDKAIAEYDGNEQDTDYTDLIGARDLLFNSDKPYDHESGLDSWNYFVTQGFGVSNVNIF